MAQNLGARVSQGERLQHPGLPSVSTRCCLQTLCQEMLRGPQKQGGSGKRQAGTLWALLVVKQAQLPKAQKHKGWDAWDSRSHHQKLQVFPVGSSWAVSNPGLHMLSSQEALIPCIKP